MVAWGTMEGITKRPENFWGHKIMFIVLTVVMVLWVYIYVKAYQTVHFQYVQFTV